MRRKRLNPKILNPEILNPKILNLQAHAGGEAPAGAPRGLVLLRLLGARPSGGERPVDRSHRTPWLGKRAAKSSQRRSPELSSPILVAHKELSADGVLWAAGGRVRHAAPLHVARHARPAADRLRQRGAQRLELPRGRPVPPRTTPGGSREVSLDSTFQRAHSFVPCCTPKAVG